MKVFNRPIKPGGHSRTIDSKTVRVLTYDIDDNVLLATGTTVPTGAGYAKGCLFIKTDAATGTKGLYENQGTKLAASFDLVGNMATADITDNSVTLAKLAAGITASHVVKFFKLGSTITTTALTGLAVGDLVVTILANGTVTVEACATINTLPSDPADTSYVIVFRATA